jgi:large subunit ribosomal protein L20
MTRIKGGLIHSKRRKSILKLTKGFRWGRKSKLKLARTASKKAEQYAFDSRKMKKRTNRSLWQIRINAAARELGLSYSALMGALKKHEILLDRKILSTLAAKHKGIFGKVVAAAK